MTDHPLQKFDLAFELSPVPMLLVAEDGVIRLTNPLMDRLFEYPPGELVGRDVEVLVPEELRELHPQLRQAFFRVPADRTMGAGRELRGVTRSGGLIPLELGLQSIEENNETYAIVAAIDIRQRKAQEQRMQTAMDASASAMIMVEERGKIVFVNDAAIKLFGYAENELMGQGIGLLVPPEIKRVHRVYLDSFFSTGGNRAMGMGQDVFGQHKNGTKIPVQIALTTVSSPSGPLVMSTIIDLTERLAGERSLAEKAEELAALNVELSHFAYSASHDLKSPLSSISGLLRICLEDLEEKNTDEVRENLHRVISISERSAKKVEGILAIARAGRDALPAEDVEIAPLIDEIWTDLTGEVSRTKFTAKLAPGQTHRTERATLRVILENLLSNALRYSDPEKPTHKVQIDGHSTGGKLEISVKDNGVGIPPEDHDKVFQIFKRLSDRSGDGLGLALVQKQVERLGGTISFNSRKGFGATFHVVLPEMES